MYLKKGTTRGKGYAHVKKGKDRVDDARVARSHLQHASVKRNQFHCEAQLEK